MISFEDLKIARFRRAWEAAAKPPRFRKPPENMPLWMVEKWREVKDDLGSFSTIEDEERDEDA